jgi:hypothetical protein
VPTVTLRRHQARGDDFTVTAAGPTNDGRNWFRLEQIWPVFRMSESSLRATFHEDRGGRFRGYGHKDTAGNWIVDREAFVMMLAEHYGVIRRRS